MKKLILSLLFIVVTIVNVSSQLKISRAQGIKMEHHAINGTVYFINSEDNGYILQDDNYGSGFITIVISDMLSAKFSIDKIEQIDRYTIRYKCHRSDKQPTLKTYPNGMLGGLEYEEGYIIKQKCKNGTKTYFWQFPPLYEGDKTTVYTTVRDD